MEEFIIQVIAIAILLLYPVWRIFKRAGLNPAISLTIFIPYVGLLVSGLILVFTTWKLNPTTKGHQ